MGRTSRGAIAAAWLAVAVVAGVTAVPAGWGQEQPPANLRPSAQGESPTDAEVLKSIQAGVEYLLKSRQGNNWETKYDVKAGNPGAAGKGWPGGNYGGETSAVVYALLHVGQGLEDERLDYKSKELQPAIKFLCNLQVDATYTAGLHANALALLMKPDRPDERPDVKKGLENDRRYLLTGMGSDGGYAYRSREEAADFADAWEHYYKAKLAKDPTLTTIKGGLDRMVTKVEDCVFGGFELAVKNLVITLNERRRDPAQQAAAGAELAELEKYVSDTRAAVLAALPQNQLADAAKRLSDTEAVLRSGKYGVKVDPTDPTRKKRVPKTKADIEGEIATLQKQIEGFQKEVKGAITPYGDLSNGQYGTLGTWALEVSHIEVMIDYWKVADKFWRLTQKSDGMWPYSAGGDNTKNTMTIAGIASLFITSEYTDTDLRLQMKPDKQIDLGLAWLNANYKPQDNRDLYFAYGAERVGLASGLKFFGPHNWYREGVKVLLGMQAPDGSWGYHGSSNLGTAYALLFLARGRNPVAFNKLEYAGNTWNARPRDVAHLAEWMTREVERPINWQRVNLEVNAEDWLDAPVLLITGSVDPKFTPDQVAKLKAYVESGGIIFSTSDGNTDGFTKAVMKYMAQICDSKFEPRELPKDHVIFSKDCWLTVTNPPRILGLSNGVRELWIHSPQDFGASWQMRRIASAKEFQIPCNVCFYATGGKKLMRSRLQPLAIADTKPVTTHSVAVARVQYEDGNWDPEPGAWPRLVKAAAVDYKLGVQLSTVKLDDLDKLDPKTVPLVHLTGTTRFRPSAERAAAIKAYLDKGGRLFVDAVGANKDFIQATQELMAQVYPDGAGVPAQLPADHCLYLGQIPGSEKITDVEFRKFAMLRMRNLGTAPRLKGVVRNGDLKIIFSEQDLTSGLLGTNTMGIIGYSANSAESLVANILLYVANGGAPKAAASVPATQTSQ